MDFLHTIKRAVRDAVFMEFKPTAEMIMRKASDFLAHDAAETVTVEKVEAKVDEVLVTIRIPVQIENARDKGKVSRWYGL